MVFESEGWQLRQAVRSLAGGGPLEVVEPSLDWWAEYERLVPIAGGREGQDVRLSGHTLALAEHRNELTGVDLTEGELDGRPTLWGTSPEGKPAVVTIALDERYTIMVLSYALALDELRRVAAELAPATEAEWIAHGGQIVDCLPTDPACDDDSAD